MCDNPKLGDPIIMFEGEATINLSQFLRLRLFVSFVLHAYLSGTLAKAYFWKSNTTHVVNLYI